MLGYGSMKLLALLVRDSVQSTNSANSKDDKKGNY